MSQLNDVYLNFIHGQWRQGNSGNWEPNRNPARPSEVLGKTTKSVALDVTKAVDSATSAHAAWAALPRSRRGQHVAKVGEILRSKAELMAKTITRESGKNLLEARAEVQKTLATLEFAAGEARRAVGQALPSDLPGRSIHTTRTPLGVVAVITPCSQPLSIAATKVALALVEGNCVILKPSSLTPGTALLLVRAFEEAALPPGVLNLLYGPGAVVGKALVEEPRVRAISFTGSQAIGQSVATRAVERLAHVELATGGKCALIVNADAHLESAVEAAVIGAFATAGQRAAATSRVLVHRTIEPEFTKRLLARADAVVIGDGLKEPRAMGPLTDEKQLEWVAQEVEIAIKDGARVALGGAKLTAPSFEGGQYFPPTVLTHVRPEMRIARLETFGPVLAVMTFENLDEAIQIANGVDVTPATTVYTNDVNATLRASERLSSRMVHFNCPTPNASEIACEADSFFYATKSVTVATLEGLGNSTALPY